VLERHGLRFEDLGLAGCTLVYRRRLEDMPRVEIPGDATPERRTKVEAARRKLLEKAIEKYRFRVEPLAAPDGLVVENDRLVGLRFRRTQIANGKLVPTDETFERRGSLVISSIGSIPEPITGIAMKGELFAFADWDLGRLDDYPTVFSAGNVVTGKGNIVASRKHASYVAEQAVAAFLGVQDDNDRTPESELTPDTNDTTDADTEAAKKAWTARIAHALSDQPPHDEPALRRLTARIQQQQANINYPATYEAWIQQATPPDLE
jgi:hypothetical protein